MRIHVIAVGRLKAGPERELVERYAGRFAATAKPLGITGPHMVELSESAARHAGERKQQESSAILAAIPAGTTAFRLDETGEHMDSVAFAHLLEKLKDNGLKSLAFIVGGADGLGEAVQQAAPRAFAFGKMTLPHQLVRVLLLEQLYRASTVLSGHPYHRA